MEKQQSTELKSNQHKTSESRDLLYSDAGYRLESVYRDNLRAYTAWRDFPTPPLPLAKTDQCAWKLLDRLRGFESFDAWNNNNNNNNENKNVKA